MKVFPPRHPATADAWAWLESRTPEQLPPQRRDHIVVRLQEIDRIFFEWDSEHAS